MKMVKDGDEYVFETIDDESLAQELFVDSSLSGNPKKKNKMSKSKIQVLLIDDNSEFANILSERLTKSNIYNIIDICADGAQV